MSNAEQVTLRKILEDRSCYDKYYPYIAAIKNMNREMRIVTMLIKTYYDKYPDISNVPRSDFVAFIQNVDKGGYSATITEFVDNLYAIDISNMDLTVDIVESVVEKHIAARVLDKVANIIDHDKKGVLPTIQDDVDEYNKIIRNPPRDVLKPYKTVIGRLIRNQIKTVGLPLCSPELTSRLMGAREGTLGLIFAFVDTGKTSFGIANMMSMAHWLETNDPNYQRPLVYAGNEEDEERVALRFMQSASGMSSKEIKDDPRTVKRRLSARGFNRIQILNGINHLSHVERICDTMNPRVLMIDQGTKVKYGKMDAHETSTLQELFNRYRELAKTHKCTIISLAQANAEGEDQMWLNMSHIYGSKVAIPGELDWAIGLGTNDEKNYRHWRYINLCKNKFGEKWGFPMEFKHESCQFIDIPNWKGK